MTSPPSPARSPTSSAAEAVTAVLVGFADALRAEGVTIGTGQVVTFCRAVARLDPSDRGDVFCAGQACLVTGRADLAVYERVFRHYFDADLAALAPPPPPEDEAVQVVTGPSVAGRSQGDAEPEEVGAQASDLEILASKRFDACSPEELERLRGLMARLRIEPPSRRSRRPRSAARPGRLDLRRTVHRSLRRQGELIDRAWQRPGTRPRPLVVLLDVSASMAPFSRALLQLAYVVARRSPRVEVFCFGTRITRITPALSTLRPDAALDDAVRAVVDWGGGTRIGAAVRGFLRDWGRQGAARGAVVVICSDGLDCGEPEDLARQMALLARLAHRVVWVNPLKADPRYQPLARGMAAALPHIDELVSGHDLTSLEELADLVGRLR